MAANEAQKDMQSNGSAMLIQHKKSKKQIVPPEDDKYCQINRRPLKSNMYADNKKLSWQKMSNNKYVVSEAPNGCAVKETCNEIK